MAKELCDKGLVQVNGQVAKASKEVKVGDIIQIKSWNRCLRIKVLAIPEGILKKKESDAWYEILEDAKLQ